MANIKDIEESVTLSGLSRQKAFLESHQQDDSDSGSLFITEKVMESMRDSGYRDIRKALNDIIDNAQQAGAKRIAIVTTTAREDKKGAREKISNIAVIDDGHGMYPKMLPFAVKWGGTDRHNMRDGLGRFGFGLPTAAVSVTRVYEVYSKLKNGEWYKVRIDLDEIAKKALTKGGNVTHTPVAVKATLPEFVKNYIKEQWKENDLEKGTVVLLINPDRIRSFSLPQTFQTKMLQNIGLTYRHFIPNITFFVNETQVEMIDPLFLNPIAKGYDSGNGHIAEGLDEIVLVVKNILRNRESAEGTIKFRFSFMDPKFQRTAENELIKNRWSTMKENNGYFIVCRGGRQIDVVREPYYQSDKDNTTIVTYDANWVIELNFDPVLDELFGITTNKQQVELDSYLWDLFKEHDLPAIVKSFRAKFKKLKEKTEDEHDEGAAAGRDSEKIMSDADEIDTLDVPTDKKEQGQTNLRNAADKAAKKKREPIKTVLEKLENESEKRKFKIEFTDLPGAPFYDLEIWGQQFRIKINTAHRFYTDIYRIQNPRGKTALELLLFVLGKSELESTGSKLLFYGNERYEWSRKLELRLKMMDELDPIIDEQSAEDEQD
jgi:hypothetical protein